jgi:hypothetical protein
MLKTQKESEYKKVTSSAPIRGLFSMPSKKVQAKKKMRSIFSKALNGGSKDGK